MVAHPVPRRIALVVHPDAPRRSRARRRSRSGPASTASTSCSSRSTAIATARWPRRARCRTVTSSWRSAATARCSRRCAPRRRATRRSSAVACGSLGALSAVTAEQLDDALERVWAGDWTARSLPALAIGAADAPDDLGRQRLRRGAPRRRPARRRRLRRRRALRADRRGRAGRGHGAGVERVLDGGRRPGAGGRHAPPSSARRWPCTAAARRRSWCRPTPW